MWGLSELITSESEETLLLIARHFFHLLSLWVEKQWMFGNLQDHQSGFLLGNLCGNLGFRLVNLCGKSVSGADVLGS